MKIYDITIARQEIRIVTFSLQATGYDQARDMARELLNHTDFSDARAVHVEDWVQDIIAREEK